MTSDHKHNPNKEMENKKTISEEKALANLANLCSKAEHCAGEMTDKMRRWGLADDAQQRILDYLTAHHFIDEDRYCQAFVEDKVKFDGWGRRKIEQALFAKRVSREAMARALDRVPDDDYLAVLRPLLHAKWPTIKARTDYERSMKLIKYAMGRGFDLRLIRLCIDDMANEEVELDDEL